MRTLASAILLLACSALPASATSITVLDDQRWLFQIAQVLGEGSDGHLETSAVRPVFGESWTQTLIGYSSHNAAFISTGTPYSEIESTLSPTFLEGVVRFGRRDEVVPYDPFGDTNLLSGGSAYFRITFTVDEETDSIWTDGAATRHETLSPGGSYILTARAGSDRFDAPSQYVSVRLVPEPGTAALLALGLAAIAARATH